jgi:hypothetical protein
VMVFSTYLIGENGVTWVTDSQLYILLPSHSTVWWPWMRISFVQDVMMEILGKFYFLVELWITGCERWWSHVIFACWWLAADLWFSPGTLVSSINKTDHHDVTEILLKVALNTITPSPWIRIHNVSGDRHWLQRWFKVSQYSTILT